MTKTEATKRARAQLRFGWFRGSSSSGWVHCPVCRAQVHAEWFPWAKPGEVQTALRTGLVAHMLEGCGSGD